MIVIHDFKEAYALFRQELIPFRLLQDQATILLDLCPQPGRHISNALAIELIDIDWLLLQPEAEEDYEGYLGGNYSFCQTEDDLKEVVGIDFTFAKANGNRWPNVLDQVMSWDACRFLPETNGEPEWAMFLLCWNDAGGPVFYVPKYLWEVARVAEHVAETDRHWSAGN
jgi:hypothetical protein